MKHRHVATAYPGRPAWINGAPYQTWERPRGTVAIDDGDCTFFYRVSRAERRAFKVWAEKRVPARFERRPHRRRMAGVSRHRPITYRKETRQCSTNPPAS